jgi:hypothetical protein
MAYEGKHAGPGKSGYSRGKREKPAESNLAYKPETITLGHLHPAHMMGMHEHIRQEKVYGQQSRNAAANSNITTGSRSEAFYNQHKDYENRGANARAVAAPLSNMADKPTSYSGRKENFELARHYGGLGIN